MTTDDQKLTEQPRHKVTSSRLDSFMEKVRREGL